MFRRGALRAFSSASTPSSARAKMPLLKKFKKPNATPKLATSHLTSGLNMTAGVNVVGTPPTVESPLSKIQPVNSRFETAMKIFEYASREPTALSVREMLEYGEKKSNTVLIGAARWLHAELPIRLARQVAALDRLPYGMGLMPSVQQVRLWYVRSFKEIVSRPPPSTAEEDLEFVTVLEHIYERHKATLYRMARGVYELKMHLAHLFDENVISANAAKLRSGQYAHNYFEGEGSQFQDALDISLLIDIHRFLDSFYSTRIGLRVLIGQHIALHQDQPPHMAGLFNKRTSPALIAEDAVEDATHICRDAKGVAPDVIIEGRTDLHFTYVPEHLHYILLELLKNSMRATVENCDDMPPIKLKIADSELNEDICIKISDQGGGIARSNMRRLWSYLYTTSQFQHSFEHDDFSGIAPLAGMGYGVPVAGQYARYFGGDLQIVSMEGEGTDSFVYLKRLGKREKVH